MGRTIRRVRAARTGVVRAVSGWGAIPRPISARPLHTLVALVRGFYRDRRAWLALLVSAVILTYGGGAVLFWFHAVYLGEGGPAISPWLHWALDSTAGFVGLTPPIAIILPVAAWLAAPAASTSLASAADRDASAVSREPPSLPNATRRPTDTTGPTRRRAGDGGRHPLAAGRGVHPLRFAVVGGVLMAVVTAPGPFLHDLLVARGTLIADQVERWFGNGKPAGTPQDVPLLVEAGQQVGAGLPVYVTMFVLAWLAVHRFARWQPT